MWSHYADRHSGVALEVEVDENIAERVKYSKARLVFDTIAKMAAGGFTEEDTINLVYTKARDWKYEREVRVLVKLTDCIKDAGLIFEPCASTFRIVGLIKGPRSSVSDADIQRSLPHGKSIAVRTSRLAFKSFEIVEDKAHPPVEVAGNGYGKAL